MKTTSQILKISTVFILLITCLSAFSQTGHIPFSITQDATLEVTVSSQTDATCGNNDGLIAVSATGGSSPYNYQWSTGDFTSGITDLFSGNYVVSVSDANGCETNLTVPVNDISAPVVAVNTVTHITCTGDQTGSIDVSISGGVTPYTIQWSNGQSTEDISSLAGGVYDIQVTDANGCIAFQSVTINEPAALDITFSTQPASCGNPDGSADVMVTGGVSPYLYAWSNGFTDAAQVSLLAAVYVVTVSDSNGCMDSIAVTLSEIGGPTITVDSVIDVSCQQTNGIIYTSISDGVAPYAITWSTGDTTSIIDSLAIGLYNVTVAGNNGCISTQSSIAVLDHPLPDPIGYVTVDTITGFNHVVWEYIIPQYIVSYNVYKESSQSGQYTLIASIPFDSLNTYIDQMSNASWHSWRYKISTVDNCGNESFLSNSHKTIHLSANAVTNGIFLVWDHYEGFGYNQYFIYRNHENEGWQMIDSISSTEFTYLDSLVAYGISSYAVSVIDSSNAGNKTVGNYNTSRSNDADEGFFPTLLKNPDNESFTVQAFPNPNSGEFVLLIESSAKEDITIKVFDLKWRELLVQTLTIQSTTQQVKMDLSSWAKGVYTVQVQGMQKVIKKKVVVQ